MSADGNLYVKLSLSVTDQKWLSSAKCVIGEAGVEVLCQSKRVVQFCGG